MMPFHPMVDGDVLPAAPADALASGAAADVALVAGTTADEMRLFVDPSAAPAPRERLVRRGRALPRRRRGRGRGAIVDDYAAVARHRRHERDLARDVRRRRDAGAVPRGARRARGARPDVHVLLHVGGPAGRRVPRHRHPVPVRQLRRRLGRVRRPRRRRARAVGVDARRLGRVRAHRRPGLAARIPRRAILGRSQHDAAAAPAVRAARRVCAEPSRFDEDASRRAAEDALDRVGRVRERAARDRFEEVHASSRRATDRGPDATTVSRQRSSGRSSRVTPSRAATSSPSSASGPVRCSGPSRSSRTSASARDRGDVGRVDPRDLARAGRQHDVTAARRRRPACRSRS